MIPCKAFLLPRSISVYWRGRPSFAWAECERELFSRGVAKEPFASISLQGPFISLRIAGTWKNFVYGYKKYAHTRRRQGSWTVTDRGQWESSHACEKSGGMGDFAQPRSLVFVPTLAHGAGGAVQCGPCGVGFLGDCCARASCILTTSCQVGGLLDGLLKIIGGCK